MEDNILVRMDSKVEKGVKKITRPLKESIAIMMDNEIQGMHDYVLDHVHERDDELKALEEKKIEIQAELIKYQNEIAEGKKKMEKEMEENRKIMEKEMEENRKTMKKEFEDFKNSMEFFGKTYDETKEQREEREKKEEEKLKELNKALAESKDLKETVTQTREGMIYNDRHMKKYNLRISKLDSFHPKEPVEDTVTQFIYNHKLMYDPHSHNEIRNYIDYAYRINSANTEDPKQILVKFRHIFVRNQVLRLSKKKERAKKMEPVFVQEDLPRADQKHKEESREYIKAAYEFGLYPRFIEGRVTTKAKNAPRRTVEKSEITKFNQNIAEGKDKLRRESEGISTIPKKQAAGQKEKTPMNKGNEHKKNPQRTNPNRDRKWSPPVKENVWKEPQTGSVPDHPSEGDKAAQEALAKLKEDYPALPIAGNLYNIQTDNRFALLAYREVNYENLLGEAMFKE
jgi:hypothetical protein